MGLDLSRNLIAITIDVEWACDEVVADLVEALDERGLRATFFCTHAGIDVPGHERAIHPNFRRDGSVVSEMGPRLADASDSQVYEWVVSRTKSFCPESVGVRAHSLFYDSDLLSHYRRAGLRYDSSYYLPLVDGVRPFFKEEGILELPIWFMDHAELLDRRTDFLSDRLRLEAPGLKVLDFHPNLVYANARNLADYERIREVYHDPSELRRLRNPGDGARSLFFDVLDAVVERSIPVATLQEIDATYREVSPAPEIGLALCSSRGA